ncbi:MAG: S9 family peptidase, partial [Pseudomonadota bacterium]
AADALPDASAYSADQYFNVGRSSEPSLSADSRKVLFLANTVDTNQVFILDLETGEQRQVTDFDDSVDLAVFSPADASVFLYGMDDRGNENTQLFLYDAGNGESVRLGSSAEAMYRYGAWSGDGGRVAYAANGRHQAFFDIYEYDIAGRHERLIVEKDAYLTADIYSDDGDVIVFSEDRGVFDRNVYMIALSGDVKPVLLNPQPGQNRMHLAYMKKSAKKIPVVSDSGLNFKRLQTFDTKKLTLKNDWPPGKRNIVEFGFSPDRSLMYFVESEPALDRLYLCDFRGGSRSIRKLKIEGAVTIDRVGISSDNNFLVMGATGADRPPCVFRYDIAGNAMTDLSQGDTAGIDERTFRKPEAVEYTTFDGRKIEAFLYLPAGAKQGDRLPCVMYIHGGPSSHFAPVFKPSIQHIVAQGYALFAPNIRGSTGYGKAFAQLDNRKKREDAVKDVIAGVDWLESSGYIDPDRIAITGESYGGYVVLACLTLYPGLWAAGIDTVGISNFVTFLENTAPYRRPLRETEYGSLDTDRSFLESISPLYRAAMIKAPLLIIHGKNDPRVPVSEAFQIRDAVKGNGGIVEMIVFDDEGHSIEKKENNTAALKKRIAFLGKHVKNCGGNAACPAEGPEAGE